MEAGKLRPVKPDGWWSHGWIQEDERGRRVWPELMASGLDLLWHWGDAQQPVRAAILEVPADKFSLKAWEKTGSIQRGEQTQKGTHPGGSSRVEGQRSRADGADGKDKAAAAGARGKWGQCRARPGPGSEGEMGWKQGELTAKWDWQQQSRWAGEVFRKRLLPIKGVAQGGITSGTDGSFIQSKSK